MTKLVKEPKWVTVYQSTDPYIVEIQKIKLEDAKIPFMVFDQRDSSYNSFGYIYINVPNEFKLNAEELLSSNNE